MPQSQQPPNMVHHYEDSTPYNHGGAVLYDSLHQGTLSSNFLTSPTARTRYAKETYRSYPPKLRVYPSSRGGPTKPTRSPRALDLHDVNHGFARIETARVPLLQLKVGVLPARASQFAHSPLRESQRACLALKDGAPTSCLAQTRVEGRRGRSRSSASQREIAYSPKYSLHYTTAAAMFQAPRTSTAALRDEDYTPYTPQGILCYDTLHKSTIPLTPP